MTIHRSTEILFEDLADMRERAARVWDYDPARPLAANLSNPTVRALEQKIAALEGAAATIAVQSGQAAIATVLMSFAQAGGTLLIPDNVYGPVRLFVENHLAPLGVRPRYYDPLVQGGLTDGELDGCSLLYLESPGSATFEVADIGMLAAQGRARGVPSVVDNTWASPAGCRPLDHGADIVLHSLSKIMSGGADVFGGALSVRDPALYRRLKNNAVFFGHWLSPDDADRIGRGLDTLPARMARGRATAATLRAYLAAQPEVRKIYTPEDQDLFANYFTTGCGLFSFLFDAAIDEPRLDRFLRALCHFGMSLGWGGPRSLIVPVNAQKSRTLMPWREDGQLMRVYAGQEEAGILCADLEQAFATLRLAWPDQVRSRSRMVLRT